MATVFSVASPFAKKPSQSQGAPRKDAWVGFLTQNRDGHDSKRKKKDDIFLKSEHFQYRCFEDFFQSFSASMSMNALRFSSVFGQERQKLCLHAPLPSLHPEPSLEITQELFARGKAEIWIMIRSVAGFLPPVFNSVGVRPGLPVKFRLHPEFQPQKSEKCRLPLDPIPLIILHPPLFISPPSSFFIPSLIPKLQAT